MITELNLSKIAKHIYNVAYRKGLPAQAIQEIISGRSQVRFVRTQGLGKCQRCGHNKHEVNGIGKLPNGERYAIGIIICPKCEVAITAYLNNNEGCTPIRPDQKGVTQYRRECGDCGRKFLITARTWEKLKQQTTHNCKGQTVDLIADEHRTLKGAYNPMGRK